MRAPYTKHKHLGTSGIPTDESPSRRLEIVSRLPNIVLVDIINVLLIVLGSFLKHWFLNIICLFFITLIFLIIIPPCFALTVKVFQSSFLSIRFSNIHVITARYVINLFSIVDSYETYLFNYVVVFYEAVIGVFPNLNNAANIGWHWTFLLNIHTYIHTDRQWDRQTRTHIFTHIHTYMQEGKGRKCFI